MSFQIGDALVGMYLYVVEDGTLETLFKTYKLDRSMPALQTYGECDRLPVRSDSQISQLLLHV